MILKTVVPNLNLIDRALKIIVHKTIGKNPLDKGYSVQVVRGCRVRINVRLTTDQFL